MKTIETLLTYADKSAKSFNQLDLILHDFVNFRQDARKYGITENIFMSIYGDLLLYQFLNFYSLLENILIAVLLGATYGQKQTQKVDGSETLGKIVQIISTFCPNHGLESEVDLELRKVLAHGWYYTENDRLVCFRNGSLESAYTMELHDLLLKFRLLNLFVRELVQVVYYADWTEQHEPD